MSGQPSSKVALVTGGSSGIGRASALAFAREGARVVVANVAVGGGEQTVRLIRDRGGEASFVVTEVSKADEVRCLVQWTVATYSRLDYAHNNAGILRSAATYELVEKGWEAVLAVNLTGAWLCMRYG